MSVELFESAELSDLGLKRKNNEDSCLRIPERGVYCVADGMGGVVGGDLASQAITNTMRDVFAQAAPDHFKTLRSTLLLVRASVNKASKWIKDFSDDKGIGQMGSTFVSLTFDPHNPTRGSALHAGDSRLYRSRNGQLAQLTADHTAAAALAAKLGRDPSTFPPRYHNELARAVGLKESVDLEETRMQNKSGDVFLLCSDGLPKMVPDETIGAMLARASTENIATIASELIRLANAAGGKDNCTVVIVKVGDISNFPRIGFEDEPVAEPAPEPEPEPAGTSDPGTRESDSKQITEEAENRSAPLAATPTSQERPSSPGSHVSETDPASPVGKLLGALRDLFTTAPDRKQEPTGTTPGKAKTLSEPPAGASNNSQVVGNNTNKGESK